MNPNVFEIDPLDMGIARIQFNLSKRIQGMEADVFEAISEKYESRDSTMPLFSIEVNCFPKTEKGGVVLQFIFKTVSGERLERSTVPRTKDEILQAVENRKFLLFCKQMVVQLLGDEVLDEDIRREMLNHTIIKIAHNETIKVLGATFHGIDEVIEYARKGISNKGVYVGEDSERYPCFDSSDYVYENRYYWNFVFAQSEEELKKKVNSLILRKPEANYKKLTDELAPMVYWEGDSFYPIEIMD